MNNTSLALYHESGLSVEEEIYPSTLLKEGEKKPVPTYDRECPDWLLHVPCAHPANNTNFFCFRKKDRDDNPAPIIDSRGETQLGRLVPSFEVAKEGTWGTCAVTGGLRA